jgi:hypothetical protein
MASEPPEIIFESEPDPLERKLRIGCGSVFGLVFGLGFGIYWWSTSLGAVLTFALVGMVACAWMALKFGDRFWTEGLAKWLPWWW